MQKIISIFFLFASCTSPDISVRSLPPLPEPVSNNAASSFQDEDGFFLYSFGGIDSTLMHSGIHQRCFQYSSKSNSWSRLPDLPDTLGKIASSASRIGEIIYIIGGYHVFDDGHEISSNKVHRFHIPTNAFLGDAARLPLAIDDQVQAVWKDSLLFVVTGWSDKRNTPTTQIYNPLTNEWSLGTPTPYKEEYMSFGASGVIIGNTIFYTGGARYENYYPAQSSLRVGIIDPKNPTSIHWRIEANNWQKAYRSGAILTSQRIYWIGGSEITYNFNAVAYESGELVQPSRKVHQYDPTKKLWRTINAPDVPMDIRNVAPLGPGVFVIIGGIGNNGKVLSSAIEVTLNY